MIKLERYITVKDLIYSWGEGCPNCGIAFDENLEVEEDEFGDHTSCKHCGISFDVEESKESIDKRKNLKYNKSLISLPKLKKDLQLTGWGQNEITTILFAVLSCNKTIEIVEG